MGGSSHPNVQDIRYWKVTSPVFIRRFVDSHSLSPVPNPLGVVGVLSAFNFPVAVYGWYF